MCDVFEERPDILQPSKKELESLSQVYLQNLTPNAKEVVDVLKKDHIVFLVTGSYEICTAPIANFLGISHVFANKLVFDNNDQFQELDKSIPLWRNDGKKQIVQQIKSRYPDHTLMIGDGQSDLDANTDTFIYFAGVVKREAVASKAKNVIYDLREVLEYIKL